MDARLSDCVQIRWENILPEQGVNIYNQEKTGKKVIVRMHYHVIEHLDYLLLLGTLKKAVTSLQVFGAETKDGEEEAT